MSLIIKGGLGAALMALAVVTNPTPQDYYQHLRRKQCDRVLVNRWVEASCHLTQFLPLPDWLSSRYVTHHNYGLFSIYTTHAPGLYDVSLGVGGFFIELETSSSTKDRPTSHSDRSEVSHCRYRRSRWGMLL